MFGKIRYCGDTSGPGAEFTVAVLRNPTEHKIRLSQATKWAEPTMREGPPGVAYLYP